MSIFPDHFDQLLFPSVISHFVSVIEINHSNQAYHFIKVISRLVRPIFLKK